MGKAAEPVGMASWSPVQLRGLVGGAERNCSPRASGSNSSRGAAFLYMKKEFRSFFYRKDYCYINDPFIFFPWPPVRDHCKNNL